MLAALVFLGGMLLNFGSPSRAWAAGATAGQSTAKDSRREVDFGLVELTPGKLTPITSYKHGGSMVLYAGEELHFQVVGAGPLPPIELRAGEGVYALPGTEGKQQITGPANKPLPAAMVARSTQLSLPGNAPPRVSVKVQVHGAARPKK